MPKVVKKGEGKRVEEYRGVTLIPTLYKVYASANRLREDVEGRCRRIKRGSERERIR